MYCLHLYTDRNNWKKIEMITIRNNENYLLIKMYYLHKILKHQLTIIIPPSVFMFWTKTSTTEETYPPQPPWERPHCGLPWNNILARVVVVVVVASAFRHKIRCRTKPQKPFNKKAKYPLSAIIYRSENRGAKLSRTKNPRCVHVVIVTGNIVCSAFRKHDVYF